MVVLSVPMVLVVQARRQGCGAGEPCLNKMTVMAWCLGDLQLRLLFL